MTCRPTWDAAQVYSEEQVEDLARRYLGGAERDQLDPILDDCVAVYLRELDEDGQVEFKGNAKAFIRTYGFLSAVLTYSNAGWEKRSIFLNLLVPKLPAPVEPDLAKGILDAIDLDSYRVEKQAMQKILLPGRGRRDRPGAYVDRRLPPGGGTGPALQHPAHVQRPLGYRVGRPGSCAGAYHPSDSRSGGVGHRIPQRAAELRPPERSHRA